MNFLYDSHRLTLTPCCSRVVSITFTAIFVVLSIGIGGMSLLVSLLSELTFPTALVHFLHSGVVLSDIQSHARGAARWTKTDPCYPSRYAPYRFHDICHLCSRVRLTTLFHVKARPISCDTSEPVYGPSVMTIHSFGICLRQRVRILFSVFPMPSDMQTLVV